jgi:hypothetical protein
VTRVHVEEIVQAAGVVSGVVPSHSLGPWPHMVGMSKLLSSQGSAHELLLVQSLHAQGQREHVLVHPGKAW